MIKIYKVALIGAGVSSLTLALQLQKMKGFSIRIFEKDNLQGGRMLPQLISPNVYADLGANLIDFQNAEQEGKVRQFMDTIFPGVSLSSKIKEFKEPFLLFEGNQLRVADYHKPRYYYESGFIEMISDLKKGLNEDTKVTKNTQITSIKKVEEKWALVDSFNNQSSEVYDFVVFACNGVKTADILRQSNIQELNSLQKSIEQIKYTHQIAAAFELKVKAPFSSILFKGHPITFVSSHQEKYNNQAIAVIQMNEAFSQQHFGKDQSQIGERIGVEIPEVMKNWIGKCCGVKYWYPSLIKTRKTNIFDSLQREKNGIFVTGDVAYGSSRVTGAMQASLKLAQLFRLITHINQSRSVE